jgi:hypothetical protein
LRGHSKKYSLGKKQKQWVCHTVALPFKLKPILSKAKEELLKLKYFTMQKYNLRNNPLKETKIIQDIRDIRKVRKRQHQYPKFGHAQGEIKKKPAKKYISKGGMKLRKPTILMVPEFHPVFLFFPERLHCCCIDFHCLYLHSYYNFSRTLCIKC